MHKLPRLNGFGVSNEGQYCFPSADEIFFNFYEPFFGNVSFSIVRSFHISRIKIKYAPWSRCFHERQMPKLPRLNGFCVSCERQYCYLSADEIFVNFNEPFFGNTHLTQLLSFGNVLAGSRKNTSKYRCFSERHMHKLPRLNGCGLSNERLYCYLSADEIFLNYNEPFYRNVSFNLVRSRHISKIIIKYAPWSRCFDEHQMHKLPRLNSCGTSRDGDIIIYLLTKKLFSFNERLIGNTSLTQILPFWDM